MCEDRARGLIPPPLRVFLLLTGLSVVVTYPQALHLRTAVHDFGDPLLNAWALAWTPHALATRGAGLFDANIFYPARGTLALSETLVFPALLVAPLRALGGGPILLHNVTLLSGFILSGMTMFLFVRSLTGDARAGAVAAVAFAASPIRMEHYPRVQLQLTYLMPLALYCLHRIVAGDTRRRTALLLGSSYAALFYSCIYYAVYFATVIPVVAGILIAAARRRAWPMAGHLGLAAVLAALLIAPAVPTYLRNRQQVGERQRDELQRGSAEWRDYRRPTQTSLVYGDANRVGPAERNLFGGYVLPVVASGALAAPVVTWAPYAAALAVSVDLSFGLNGHTYGWLYDHVLAYRALRVPARFAVLVNMWLAILAGIGSARLMALLRSERARNAVLVLLVGGLGVESLNRFVPLREMPPETPGVYQWLRSAEYGPIVEYPVDGLEGRSGPQDPTYMYYATTHWRPMLNGYSGFVTPSYGELLDRLRDFPSDVSIGYLRERGARYLLVHEDFYLNGGFEADIDALRHARRVTERAMFRDPALGRTYVYELRN